jgi:predicted metal-dependent phosphoesterase TrpH
MPAASPGGRSAGSARREIPSDPVIPPGPSALDLHSHTLRSDGLLEPIDLVRQAAAAGVRLLAVTDHDTLAGVRELSVRADLPGGIEVLPGIELNAVTEGHPGLQEGEVHVLGLGVDPSDEALEAALARQRRNRHLRFDKMVVRLRDAGLPVDGALDQLPPVGEEDALGRPRLARALVALGHASSVADAFDRFLSRGQVGYVPREGLGPIESIAAIRGAGGVAVLAHFAEAPARRSLLVELMDAGLRGLEVHYRSFDRATTEAVGEVARSIGLLATGGTDFHGDRETYAEAHAAIWVPPTVEGPLREAMAGARAGAAT